jgi:DNA-binding response OmpR family regulator
MNSIKQNTRYKRILLIEDDELDVFIASRIMKAESFAQEILAKPSAEAALDYIRTAIQNGNELPEIIFLDLGLPGKSGFDFMDELELISNENNIRFRLIILTAIIPFKIEVDEMKKYRMAEAILEKPLTTDVLAQF